MAYRTCRRWKKRDGKTIKKGRCNHCEKIVFIENTQGEINRNIKRRTTTKSEKANQFGLGKGMKSCKNMGMGNIVCYAVMRLRIPEFPPQPLLFFYWLQSKLWEITIFFVFLQGLSLDKQNILVVLTAIWHHRCHIGLSGIRMVLLFFCDEKIALWERILFKDMLWLSLSPCFTARMAEIGKHSCRFSCPHTPTCPSCPLSCSSTMS